MTGANLSKYLLIEESLIYKNRLRVKVVIMYILSLQDRAVGLLQNLNILLLHFLPRDILFQPAVR